jgi:hypothetical protein
MTSPPTSLPSFSMRRRQLKGGDVPLATRFRRTFHLCIKIPLPTPWVLTFSLYTIRETAAFTGGGPTSLQATLREFRSSVLEPGPLISILDARLGDFKGRTTLPGAVRHRQRFLLGLHLGRRGQRFTYYSMARATRRLQFKHFSGGSLLCWSSSSTLKDLRKVLPPPGQQLAAGWHACRRWPAEGQLQQRSFYPARNRD